MTPARPEHEGAHGGPDGRSNGPSPFPPPEAFQAAVDALADPLNDPLPGSAPSPPARPARSAVDALADPLNDPLPGRPSRAGERPRPGWADPEPSEAGRPGPRQPSGPPDAPEPRGAEHAAGSPWFRPHRAPASRQEQPASASPGAPLVSGTPPRSRPRPQGDAETTTLRRVRNPGTPTAGPALVGAAPAVSATVPVTGGEPFADDERRTVGLRRPEPAELGGRAARRRAAKARGRKTGAPAAAPEPPRAPMSRVEARRAARAASREGLALVASRVTGEVFISVGVLMLLFVAYQLWWTNVLAGQEAGGRADQLQEKWTAKVAPERRAGAFAAGEGFAIIHIPKIDIHTPIAQGVSKKQVLDKGLVGHYDQAPLNTAMPWEKDGNFALAGHRNTHGEPFRYINRLVGGDEIVVETSDTYYTYQMANRLAATDPSNTSVIQPVPPQSGFTGPGRYITLTTCTPEFTSKYRLIVWGKMVDERPRSKGKPDALVE